MLHKIRGIDVALKKSLAAYGVTVWVDNTVKTLYDYQVELALRELQTLEKRPAEYPASRQWDDAHYRQMQSMRNIPDITERNGWLSWTPYVNIICVYVNTGALGVTCQNAGFLYNMNTGELGYHEVMYFQQWNSLYKNIPAFAVNF